MRWAIKARKQFILWSIGGFIGLFAFSHYALRAETETLNGFELKEPLISSDKIKEGGPPKDGIPSIDDPKFYSSREQVLEAFSKKTKAIAVERNGKHKLYPIAILNWHEIVNDEISETPITVTYCPLCGTGMIFHAKANGKRLKFGVSGLLYKSDMILYDRQTESLWPQIKRKAISGPMKGTELKIISSKVVQLGPYLKENPQTKVLSKATGYSRDYENSPYDNYSKKDQTLFPVEQLDRTYHIKTWTLAIVSEKESEQKSVLIPSKNLENKSYQFQANGQTYQISYSKDTNAFECKNEKEHSCIQGYWFALKAFHPEAKVIDWNQLKEN